MVGPVIPRGRARRRVAFQVAGWAVLLLVLRLTVVPAESKRFARIQVLETVIAKLEAALD